MPIPYCVSLIMVTITSHIFINIFQTVHFPAVKFTRGNEKNTSFLLIPKSPKVWEKSEVIGPGSFKSVSERSMLRVCDDDKITCAMFEYESGLNTPDCYQCLYNYNYVAEVLYPGMCWWCLSFMHWFMYANCFCSCCWSIGSIQLLNA